MFIQQDLSVIGKTTKNTPNLSTMISTGQKIDTGISLEVVQNGETRTTTVQALLDRPTIFSVYMKNNTGSCDKQNDSLVASAAEIDGLGYNLVAISKDSCKAHLNYATKKGIPYTLASDPDNAFTQAVDGMVEKKMRGKTYMGPARAAYIIDTDGTVQAVIEKIKSAEHGPELISLLHTLR